jgi:glycosyltransferase involved in cell wall biosynthesis
MKLISVIIPTYKRGQFLDRSIKSILKQTYPWFELIVVDDDIDNGSAKEVVEKFNDKRIKYFANERKKGANGARNTGILNARGDYLAFLDDDDEFLSNRLDISVKFMESNKFDGCISGYMLVNNNTTKKINIKSDISLENFLKGYLPLGASSNLFFKNIDNKNDLLWNEELMRHQDIEFVARFLFKYNIGYIDNTLILINGHNGTPSAEKLEIEKMKLIQILSTILDGVDKSVKNFYISNNYKDLALFFAQEDQFKLFKKYLFKSFSYKILPPRNYLSLILTLMQKIPFLVRRFIF